MTVPDYAVLLIFCTVIFMALTLSALFTHALSVANLSTSERKRTGWSILSFVTIWVIFALGLAYSNVLVPREDQWFPLLGALIVGITILSIALLLRSRRFKAVLDATPLHWLVAVQTYRVIGLVFLLLQTDGLLSSYFATSTGWGDIAVGVTAPIVGFLMWKEPGRFFWVALTWSVAGIADLLFVLYKAVQSAPGPLQTTAFDTPTVIVGYFPFPLIPLIVVPMSLILHALVIRKLLSQPHTRDGDL